MTENINLLVQLRMAAREALAKCEGRPSPAQALKFFEPMVLEDPELCKALLLSAQQDTRDKILIEELRKVFVGDKNSEAGGKPENVRPAASKRSNVVAPYTGGPSPTDIAASRVGRKASIAAIYSAQETMIGGRFFHTFSYGELVSLKSIKRKKIERLGDDITKLTEEQRRERYELRFIELVTGHAQPADQTVSAVDVVAAKKLAKIAEQAKAETEAEADHA